MTGSTIIELLSIIKSQGAALAFYSQFLRECDYDDWLKYVGDKGKTAHAALTEATARLEKLAGEK